MIVVKRGEITNTMVSMDRGAEIALGATLVACVAAWRYHLHVGHIDHNHSEHGAGYAALQGGVPVDGVSVGEHMQHGDDVVEHTDADGDESDATPHDPGRRPSDGDAQMAEETHLMERHAQEQMQESARQKAQELQKLQSELALLGRAREDGWSALFAPLPSSETDEQIAVAKKGLVARISAITSGA
jgi:hypothetical protein